VTKTTITEKQADAIMAWFYTHARTLPWRGETDPYRIWISEVMLQQTQVITVIPYYEKWLHTFPTLEKLARTGIENVLMAWEGLGYYSRARNIHKSARYITRELSGKFPDNYTDILKLTGVGTYIAAAIASIAFNEPVGTVDGNIIRVVARLFHLTDVSNTVSFKQQVRNIIESGFHSHEPRWFNQAIMEFGALQCTKNPDCNPCVMQPNCKAYSAKMVKNIPVKPARSKPPTRTGAAFIIQNGTKLLMIKRPPEGLLGGLWELPNVMFDEMELETFIKNSNLKDIQPLSLITHHQYSHFKVVYHLYTATLNGKWPRKTGMDSAWVTPGQISRLPKPKVHIKALKLTGWINRD
jgi:A/G-specific adenine glycosylase